MKRPTLLACLLLALPLWGCGEDPAPPAPASDGIRYDAKGVLVGAPKPKAGTQRPNLVVLLIDTLRSDAVGLPSAPEGLMPSVTALAREGVSFPDATAPAPWTVPSFTSLLTGLLPSSHGCDAPSKPPRLLGAVTTFAEALGNTYGYETAAFTSGPWLSDRETVLQGFQYGAHQFALQGTARIVEGFARKRDPQRPFFLLLHSFEAHDPYGARNHPWPVLPEKPGRRSGLDLKAVTQPWELSRHFFLDRDARLDLLEMHGTELHKQVIRYVHGGFRAEPRMDLADELAAGYDDGVRWVDGLVKSTLEQLESWGMLENTVLVVTSDHGEAFGEHGILAHGRQLYDELVRIPLVITGPEPFAGGREIPGGVGLLDVLPTFFDFAGLVPLDGIRGRSFLPLIRGETEGRPIFSEEVLSRENTGEADDAVLTSVRSTRWKYIITFDKRAGTVMEEAYDLLRDPGEHRDLCEGTGRIDDLPFDETFCEAVEMARDRIWGAAGQSNRLYTSPYGAGRAQVTSKRPRACGVTSGD